jgi:uncharacterized cupin superfamily protein
LSVRYVITKEEIDAFDGVDKIHFLNPGARRRNKSLGDLAGLSNLGFHLIEVQPGYSSTEVHVHWFEDECIYVLEGEALATIGSEVHRVRAGDFIGCPAGGPAHKLENPGPGLLRCLVAGARLAQDVVDYPLLGKRLYRNAGHPWNVVDFGAIAEPESAGKK